VVKTKNIEGVGECLVLPASFIEKIMEVIIKSLNDDNFYYLTKLKPYQEIVINRGITLEGDIFYCYITKKELRRLNEKFKEAQDKAQMDF